MNATWTAVAATPSLDLALTPVGATWTATTVQFALYGSVTVGWMEMLNQVQGVLEVRAQYDGEIQLVNQVQARVSSQSRSI